MSSQRGRPPPTQRSTHQLNDAGWKQRVDKELTKHVSDMYGADLRPGAPLPPPAPPARGRPASLPPYATSADNDSASGTAPRINAAATRPLPPYVGHATLADGTRPPPSLSGSRPGQPPPTASSIASGSRRSLCTSLPPAASEVSVATAGTDVTARLEQLEHMFMQEREARLKLEQQLQRVESVHAKPGATRGAGGVRAKQQPAAARRSNGLQKR